MCNGAEVFHQFAVRHPQAGVGDGDGARLVIRGHADGRRRFRLEDGLPEDWLNRSFSHASAALEISSRTKISLSV
jgi:hypothetical protein